jgi:dTDP-4-dehydrorhamnose reductase
MKVLILGSSGLLGNTFFEFLNKKKLESNLKFFFTFRKKIKNHILFDVTKKETYKNIKKIKPNIIVNCIGIIKPHINEKSPTSIVNAFEINSIFPSTLIRMFPKSKIIHFNTDCVFTGKSGYYKENQIKDCDDIYGISKSLGEINSRRVMNLRCSIIGKEKNTKFSLLSWFLNNKNIKINGFTNHYWNGLTTLALVKIVNGIIINKSFKHGLFNIVPYDTVTKYELLRMFNNKFFINNKKKIVPVKHTVMVNRILSTNNENCNKRLWKNAGYQRVQSIKEMIEEL